MREFLRDFAYQLTRKHIEENRLVVCELRKNREELSFFSLSTNTVISFLHNEQVCYFRECPRIQEEEAYWTQTIDRFFDSLDRLRISKTHFSQQIPIRVAFSDEEIIKFADYISKRRFASEFRVMLKNADRIAKRINFSIWEKQNYDADFFAQFAVADLAEDCRELAVYFLWNMRAAAAAYRQRKLVRGKTYSFFAASKAVASQIVAEELNLGHLITPVTWCRLITDDGASRFGVLSPAAPGGRMIDQLISITPSLQRELSCLNVLNVICNQPDHGPNNYNVLVRETGDCSVCAFDNDNGRTFFPQFTVSGSMAGCAPLVTKENRIHRPYMDKTLAEELDKLNLPHLRRRLMPYLNRLQIAGVCFRIRKLRKAIRQTRHEKPDFLLDAASWSQDTVREELAGKYGTTYLKRIG